jgi:plastocyanin
MCRIKTMVAACTLVMLVAAPVRAEQVTVTLANFGTAGETGSGTAKVDLALGKAEVVLQDLKAVSHAGANGLNVLGYSAWLVNSENALGKLNLGLVLPKADGTAFLAFQAPTARANLTGLGFNMVVVTADTELDTARSQPSGPPIAAGPIPGTATAVTPPPAFEVLMGKLDNDVFAFQPAQITILSGQSVRWTNVSPVFIVPHTATRDEATDGIVPSPGEVFDSGPVAPNTSFVRTFTLPEGTPFALWNYHCTPHLQLGMTGRILVIAPPQQ